ncbi:MAG: hypothetical protein L0099_00025, partial [Acidobacteria bacterium]|nr:hypothetical protein [Acidobacteriota bacterium]
MANAALRALLDRLPELHARLRAAEFVPDAARWLAANDLLLRLYEQNRFPGDAESLRRLLAPLFCSNRTQQVDFNRVFTQWAQGDEAPPSPTVVRFSPAGEQGLRRYVQGTRRWPLWVAGLALLAAIGAGGYFLYQYIYRSPVEIVEKAKEPKTTESSGPSTELKDTGLTPQPIPPRSPPEPFRHSDEVNALLLGLRYTFAAMPGLIALGWWVDRRRRRRAILRQRASDSDDPLLHLPLSRSGALPYWGGHIPRVLHRLRRGAPMETRQLDI